MKESALALTKIHAGHYSFLSGVFISLAVNLYSGVFATDTVPHRWRVILLSAAFTTASSVAWMALSWKCESIQRAAAFKGMDPATTYALLLEKHQSAILTWFSVAVAAAVIGLLVLRFGY